MTAAEKTVIESNKSGTKPPDMFNVLLLNYDFTPMEFVVVVLERFFSKSREQATQIMLKVHREGQAVCGIYPKDIAETKMEQVVAFSRQNEHPLRCVMEEM